MGMTIEDCISKLIEILEEATEDENAVCYVTDVDEPTLKMAIETMRKYQQLQTNYENRLKADMVAMLKELKEQLREMHEDFFETEYFDEAYGVSDSMDVIQQKIDALKGGKHMNDYAFQNLIEVLKQIRDELKELNKNLSK